MELVQGVALLLGLLSHLRCVLSSFFKVHFNVRYAHLLYILWDFFLNWWLVIYGTSHNDGNNYGFLNITKSNSCFDSSPKLLKCWFEHTLQWQHWISHYTTLIFSASFHVFHNIKISLLMKIVNTPASVCPLHLSSS